MGTKRIETVHNLRGIAALAVAWFHLAYSNTSFLPRGALASTAKYGWLGVEVFFVISGFVLPYSLYKGEFDLSKYHKFVTKRIIRLEPPYIASILLVLALGYLSAVTPGFKGQAFSINPAQLVLHLGYLNGLFGYPPLSGPYWTLAIEFQWYLLVGLLYALVVHRNRRVALALFVCFTAIAFLSSSQDWMVRFIPLSPYLPLFLIGVLTFRLKAGRTGRAEYALCLGLLGVAELFRGGAPHAIAGVGASLVIVADRLDYRVSRFLGDVSYSLYLIHEPIGVRVENLTGRYVHSFAGRSAIVLFAMGLCLLVAYLLYRFVERPALALSKRIKYQQDGRAERIASEVIGAAKAATASLSSDVRQQERLGIPSVLQVIEEK